MAPTTKLIIAAEQLEDALQAFFNGRYHSAIVLAGAAEQLLAGYMLKHGLSPAWHQEQKTITKIANGLKARDEAATEATTEKDIGDLMNHAYNHSKHAGKKDHVVAFDSKFEAMSIIDRALSNYDVLSARPEYSLDYLSLAHRFYTAPLDESGLPSASPAVGKAAGDAA